MTDWGAYDDVPPTRVDVAAGAAIVGVVVAVLVWIARKVLS